MRQLARIGHEAVDQSRLVAVRQEAMTLAQLYQLGFQQRVKVCNLEIDLDSHGYERGIVQHDRRS